MHPRAEAAVLLLDGDRVVEVLRGLGIDREAELVAQVDAVGHVRLRCFVGLELAMGPGMDEQPLEHGLDVRGLAELALDARAPTAGANDDQVAGTDVTAPLAVDLDGDVRDEERLADELLAALVDLDD